MNNKSIDGLQRRSGKTTTKKVTTPKKQTKTSKSIKVTTPKTSQKKTKSIGIPDKKKDLKKLISESEKLEEANNIEDENQSVKEFLSENYSKDIDNLIDLPQKSKKKAKKNKKADKPKKKHKKLKRAALVVVLLLLGVGAGLYFYLNDFVSTVTDNGNILNVLFSDPDTPLEKDENGRTNILVFGTEGYVMDDPNYDGGFLTDAMMILSINQDSNDVKAISLPRDLKMPQTCTATGKMNEIYWCEYLNYLNSDKKTNDLKKQTESSAGDKLAKKFQEITGLKVHYRVHINWKVLIQTVDALGGIDVCFYYEGNNKCPADTTAIEVSDERGLSEQDYTVGKTYFAYKTNKKYHLIGYKALQVARARNAYGGYGASGGNFSREYFQQRIIEATARKAREKNLDIGTVLQLKGALGDNVRTNFKDTEIKTLLKLITTIDTNNMETISLQKANLLSSAMINGISYIVPAAGTYEYSAIKTFVAKAMKGEDFASEEAKVVVLNGTNVNGVAGNEKIDLEDAGFTVVDTDNAPKDLSSFDGVKVFQFNNKNPKTAKALKKRYNVELQTKIPESIKNYTCDFVVVIGKGYNNN